MIYKHDRLRVLLTYFPNSCLSEPRHVDHFHAWLISSILWESGAKTARFGHRFLSGHREACNILVDNSITVTPYIKSPYTDQGKQPLLWWLFKNSGYGISGVADEDGDYMQCYVSSRIQNVQTEFDVNLISHVIMYFNALKEEFGTNHKRQVQAIKPCGWKRKYVKTTRALPRS